MLKLRRDEHNPILERDTYAGYDTLFNPGVCDVGDCVYLIVRAARDDRKYAARSQRSAFYTNQVSDHLIFISRDNGITFDFTGRKMTGSSSTWVDAGEGENAHVPTYFGPYGAEDVRLCRLGDLYVGVSHVMTHPPYTGDEKAGGRVGLILTRDFRHYRRYLVGPGREEGDRDSWLMEHQGKIAYFTRIKPDKAGRRGLKYPSIQVVHFDTLDDLINAPPDFWADYLENIQKYTIMEPYYPWEGEQIGGGPVLEHTRGYLMFYHGVRRQEGYYTGAALLDKQSLRCIKRTSEPVLSPEKWYETGAFGGDTRNITFPNGARYCRENQIEIYYGAADSHTARAFVDDVDAFVQAMPEFDPV